MDQYVIPLNGVREGESEYIFTVNNKFFEQFKNSEISIANIVVKCIVYKTGSLMDMTIHLMGEVEVVCDRCLDLFMYAVNNTYKLYIKTSPDKKEEEAEIIYITGFEQQLNVAQYIYEYINFSIPLKKTHPENIRGESLCNKQMLNKIKELSNKKGLKDKIDPRWERLINLREN